MKSTLFIFLVCAAAVTIGAQQPSGSSASDREFCMKHNVEGKLLANENCTLACNNTEPATNTTRAPPGTPCLYSLGANDGSGSAEMRNGTCLGEKCTPTGKESSNSSMTPTTQKANVTSAPGSTKMQTSPQNGTTMPASWNASSHATGTTMAPTASHNGTTMLANTTTTEKPKGSAASPSRLLGAANQGAIITVLALAVFGRSL